MIGLWWLMGRLVRWFGVRLAPRVHSIEYYPSLYFGQASDAWIRCLPRSSHKVQKDNKSLCVLTHSFSGAERWKLLWCSLSTWPGERKQKNTPFLSAFFPSHSPYIMKQHWNNATKHLFQVWYHFETTPVRFQRVWDAQRDETDCLIYSQLASSVSWRTSFLLSGSGVVQRTVFTDEFRPADSWLQAAHVWQL